MPLRFVSGLVFFQRCALHSNHQQMPILEHETHRHRKFLTRALHDTEIAMQIARAQNASLDQNAGGSFEEEDSGPEQESE